MTANAAPEPFPDPRMEEPAAALRAAADECRRDPSLQAELDADPRAFFAARGLDIPTGADLKVAANTPEVFHLVMPADPQRHPLRRNAGPRFRRHGPPGVQHHQLAEHDPVVREQRQHRARALQLNGRAFPSHMFWLQTPRGGGPGAAIIGTV